MRYATLSNNQIHYAPNPIIVDGRVLGNPPGEVYAAQGYLPVIETEPPEVDELHYAEPRYVERDGSIVQEWGLVEIEQPPMTDEDALVRYANELTGANDPDLLSAAETLIEQRIKEDK